MPATVGVVERDGVRPVVIADNQPHAVRVGPDQRMPLVVGGDKFLPRRRIDGRIAGIDQLVAARSQNRHDGVGFVAANRVE
jgi:hypothetical protein